VYMALAYIELCLSNIDSRGHVYVNNSFKVRTVSSLLFYM